MVLTIGHVMSVQEDLGAPVSLSMEHEGGSLGLRLERSVGAIGCTVLCVLGAKEDLGVCGSQHRTSLEHDRKGSRISVLEQLACSCSI